MKKTILLITCIMVLCSQAMAKDQNQMIHTKAGGVNTVYYGYTAYVKAKVNSCALKLKEVYKSYFPTIVQNYPIISLSLAATIMAVGRLFVRTYLSARATEALKKKEKERLKEEAEEKRLKKEAEEKRLKEEEKEKRKKKKDEILKKKEERSQKGHDLGSADLNLIDEIKKLEQTPKDYPSAKSLTKEIFLDALEKGTEILKDKKDSEAWVEGGDEGYYFVRKLVLPDDAVVAFRGDLHGDVHSLIRWLDVLRADGWFEKENPFKLTAESLEKNRYLAFLGDYVDRGHYGAEVMYIIMRLLIENEDNVLLVRGNHEDISIVSKYGYINELNKKFLPDDNEIKKITDIYEHLPVAIFLGCDNGNGGVDFVQCCHGGMGIDHDTSGLLDSEENDVYQWLDDYRNESDNDRKIELIYKRSPGLKEELQRSENWLINTDFYSENNYMWNDFDFKNDNPNKLLSPCQYRAPKIHKKYTDYLLRTATKKDSKNNVFSVFHAHDHSPCTGGTVEHIIKYGNGVYKHWSEKTTDAKQWSGDQNQQWSGESGASVPIERYSVWIFNVAPCTGHYEVSFIDNKGNKLEAVKNFNYDTTAELHMAKGFNNWKLYPRKIPVDVLKSKD